MNKKSQLGKEGEDFAEWYLKRKGFRIIERNYRRKWGELDIVAQTPDKTLVFVEVKTLRQTQGVPLEEQLKPEDQMTSEKMKKFRRTAELYAGSHPEMVFEKMGWRLDLVALLKNPDSSFLVRHYENI